MKRILLSMLLSCITIAMAYAQPNPVHWTHSANHIEGDIYELVFKAKIDEGYYTYSMFLEGDDGPIRTSINIESGKATKEGKATEGSSDPANIKTSYDKMFDMELKKFKKDIILKQRVKCTDPKTPIEGYVETMACNATSCTPPTPYEFSFDLSKLKPKDVKAENNSPEKTDEGNTDEATSEETNAEEKDEKKEEEPSEEDNGELKPVNWDISIKSLGNNEFELSFTAAIDEGWHVYSSNLESDEGPIATSINIAENDNIKLVGEVVESTSEEGNRKEGKDPLFDDMNVIKYKHDFTLKQKISVKDTTKVLEGFLTFMTCNNERCLPPTDIDFNFFKAAANTAGVKTIKREKMVSSLEKVMAGEGGCGNETQSNNLSFLMIFIFGFVGGLFALLTPCVFPMVPLTVSFFTKRSKSRAEGIRNALIYGLSIIVIYVALGMSITIIFGDNALNWLSTHWIPNTLFFVMFIAFAISFFGYYEITLPSSWSNNTDRAADRGGLIGIFFMAFTLSLVSFSCTGPIIGTLLVQAAEGGRLAPAIGMLGFSSALALPFALFSAFPGWLNSLPRSGGWMNTVKVVLGFIEVALAFKFLSKADLTMHWGILKYEPFMVIYILSAIAMGIYLLGFIHFPHDSKGAKIGIPRKVLGVLSIALGIYFATGFMVNPTTKTYATPAVMSGLAPPACYSYACPCDCPAGLEDCFKLKSLAKKEATEEKEEEDAKTKLSSYEEVLEHALKSDKPILIDFTGHGCENCRKMEDQIWTDAEINDLLRKYTLVSLYVDDREKLAVVEKADDGTKLRNVGNLWAAFERVNFEQQSQPLYIAIAPDETVLNEPVAAMLNDKKGYKEFLECGIDNYEAWKAKQ